MFFDKFRIVFLLVAFEIGVDGANILALLTSASQSHHIMQTKILEELANRGHNVHSSEENQSCSSILQFHFLFL